MEHTGLDSKKVPISYFYGGIFPLIPAFWYDTFHCSALYRFYIREEVGRYHPTNEGTYFKTQKPDGHYG